MALQWNAAQAVQSLEEQAWQRLVRTAQYFTDKCMEAVGIPNTGQRMVRTRDTVAGRKGSSYTVYPDPAKPGEPPRKRTGFGQRNIVQVRDRSSMTIKVGEHKNAAYMIWLELRGWPWLLATLTAERQNLQAIVTAKST